MLNFEDRETQGTFLQDDVSPNGWGVASVPPSCFYDQRTHPCLHPPVPTSFVNRLFHPPCLKPQCVWYPPSLKSLLCPPLVVFPWFFYRFRLLSSAGSSLSRNPLGPDPCPPRDRVTTVDAVANEFVKRSLSFYFSVLREIWLFADACFGLSRSACEE